MQLRNFRIFSKSSSSIILLSALYFYRRETLSFSVQRRTFSTIRSRINSSRSRSNNGLRCWKGSSRDKNYYRPFSLLQLVPPPVPRLLSTTTLTVSLSVDMMTSSSSLVTPSDTLHGLLVEITNTDNNDNDNTTTSIPEQTLKDACHVLQQFATVDNIVQDNNNNNNNNNNNSNDDDVRKILSSYASIAAERLCQIAHSTTENTKNKPTKKNKKRTWIELQDAAGILQQQIPSTTTATSSSLESNALAVSLVFGALSIMQRQNQSSGSAKAAASAFSSTIFRNEPLQDVGRSVSALLLQSYIRNAFDNADNYINFDLNILSHLAKSFRLTEESVEPSDTATVVRKALVQSQQHLTNNDDDPKVTDETKQIISGALALANQLRPWSDLSPMELIDAAVAYDYYHAAEEICKTAYNCTAATTVSEASKNGCDMNDDNRNVFSASQQRINVRYAVERLIDTAMEDRSYRLADSLATSLYDMGGQSRYIKARYYHACDTIAKVITKGQLPIVDRQIERVDRAVAKVKKEDDDEGNSDDTNYDDKSKYDGTGDVTLPAISTSTVNFSPCAEIRNYAIGKMEEVGQIDGAQRLASLYGVDYVYDEKAANIAAALRRQKYLQYEDVLSGTVPSLISTPDELLLGFDRLLENGGAKVFGFDAEWDEETKGAALLQLANSKMVLLIDIPAISSTERGVKALKETVGDLLDSPTFTAVGFSCKQDLSRLRASPCVHQQQEVSGHWMAGTRAVVDLQTLVRDAEPSLRKTGLSRACEHYLSKPLDKSEQCSLWSGRPLSERQRSYASLDAWVCVGVYNKLEC